MSLESVDDIDGGDGLSLGVFSVGDGITDDVLEESSQDEAGLVVDERRDSLDTTASGESADGRLGDAHDGGLEGGLGASLSAGLAGNLAELAALAAVDGSHDRLIIIIRQTRRLKYKSKQLYLVNFAI